jgi:hypothetical protein
MKVGDILRYVEIGLTNIPGQPSISLVQEHTSSKDGESINNLLPTTEKGKEFSFEHFHTWGSLSNVISWGEQPILKLVDKVANVQEITYDKKRQVIFRRKEKNMRLTLDSVVMITTKETLVDTRNSKVSELLGAGMFISSATIDRAREDEPEAESMKKKLEHIRHQAKYYQDTTWEIIFVKDEFLVGYNQFKIERDTFMAKVVSYQKETFLGLMAFKEMSRFFKQSHKVLEQI